MSGQTGCGGKVSVSSCISERPRTTLNLIPVRLKDEDEDKTVDALAAVYIKKLQFPLKTEKNHVCLTGKESCLNSHRANKSQLKSTRVNLSDLLLIELIARAKCDRVNV